MSKVKVKKEVEQDLAKAISAVSKLRKQDYPSDWEIVKLGDILDVQGGSQPPKSTFIFKPKEGYIRLLQIRDFGAKPVPTYVPIDKVTKFCEKDDIFIARYGASLGRIITGMEGAYNVALAKVILDRDVIFIRYMFYLLKTPYFQTPIHMISRSAQNGFNKGEIFPIEVPLAPYNQQKRIVAEIEKQFSRLDEAVANLKRVKANLKRYKAAVLKAAVEGKLTEEWRKAHPDVEPADKLLECILTERRKKWEETEFAKMKAKGKEPKDNKWKTKYKEACGPEIEDLPPIPESWTWATLPQLGELNRGKSKHRPRNDPILYGGQYPFVQTGDVRHSTGYIREFSQTYSDEGLKQSRLWPMGTLCITIAANIADTAILSFDSCFPDSIVGFIPDRDSIEVKFIEYFTRTAKENLERYAPATAQKNINLAILGNAAVPVPPEKEQKLIIQEIESRLSVAEEIEKELDNNVKRAERLRQSILSKAFSGKLLKHDHHIKGLKVAI